MTEILPCLLRIGDNVKKYKVFKLDRKQVTIGRSGEVTYAILSNMISRCHAFVKHQEDGSWTISDNKSLNGVFVNGRQLSPLTPYTLQDGDMVQFGVPTSPNVPAEFIYKFYSSLKVRVEKKAKRLKSEVPLESEKATLSFSESSECDDDREYKRKTALNKSCGGDSPSKKMKEQMQKDQAAKEAEYQSRLAEMEKLLKEKEEEQLKVQQQLDRERAEKEHQAREVEELRLKEMAILTEMEDKQKQLEKEKEDLRLRMQAELESSLKEREAALMAQLNAQKESLINEKLQIEESLQREMAKALEEKDKELEQHLLEQKENLEKVLEKKEVEQKVLEAQLNETKEKSENHALKAKEEVLSNFVDLMEMELQCAICNELFIKATSLNCSHTFCKLCIHQWMRVKKECPNCRKPILSQMQAIALDSYIDKMVEQLNDELKQRRTELVAQRKVEQDRFDNQLPGPSRVAPPPPVAPTPPAPRPAAPTAPAATRAPAPQPVRQSTRSTRGRGRGRGRAGAATTAPRHVGPGVQTATVVIAGPAQTTANNTAAPTMPAPTATQRPTPPTANTTPAATTTSTGVTVIELTDEEEDEDFVPVDVEEEDERSLNTDVTSSSAEGDYDDDAYYGGYGRCYNCGRHGHWANGCPY